MNLKRRGAGCGPRRETADGQTGRLHEGDRLGHLDAGCTCAAALGVSRQGTLELVSQVPVINRQPALSRKTRLLLAIACIISPELQELAGDIAADAGILKVTV